MLLKFNSSVLLVYLCLQSETAVRRERKRERERAYGWQEAATVL